MFTGVILRLQHYYMSYVNMSRDFRVLLRVRLLYYLKQEVIGDEAEKVFSGLPARYGCLSAVLR